MVYCFRGVWWVFSQVSRSEGQPGVGLLVASFFACVFRRCVVILRCCYSEAERKSANTTAPETSNRCTASSCARQETSCNQSLAAPSLACCSSRGMAISANFQTVYLGEGRGSGTFFCLFLGNGMY